MWLNAFNREVAIFLSAHVYQPVYFDKSVHYDSPGECSCEDCLWWHWLMFRQPEQQSSSESSEL